MIPVESFPRLPTTREAPFGASLGLAQSSESDNTRLCHARLGLQAGLESVEAGRQAVPLEMDALDGAS